MKLFLVFIATLGYLASSLIGNPISSTAIVSKVQPKDVVLSKDSKDPKGKPVLFSHETHSTKNYSADGKSVIGCAECHHTDQPKSALTGVLKTSERDVMLTTASLAAADAKPVKTCRECHAQAGQKPASWPKIPEVTYPDESDATVLTNDEAYHRNCNTCHDKVKERDPKTKAPTTCASCHGTASAD